MNIFNHRLWSVLIDTKQSFRTDDVSASDTYWSHILQSLIGLNNKYLTKQLKLPLTQLLRLSQLLIAPKASVTQIEQVLAIVLKVPVRVEKLIGQFCPLERDQITCISGTKNQYNQLGVDTVLGSNVWNQHHAIKVNISVNSLEQYIACLPGNKLNHVLKEILFLLTRKRVNIHVKLHLDPYKKPVARLYQKSPWKLGVNRKTETLFDMGRLGKSSYLMSGEQQKGLGHNLLTLGQTAWLKSNRGPPDSEKVHRANTRTITYTINTTDQ